MNLSPSPSNVSGKTAEIRPAGPVRRRPDRLIGLRIFNALARCAEAVGWRFRIDADRIMNRVRRQTGLDWEDRSFVEPLRTLAGALDQEANLHPIGRVIMSMNLAFFLRNRLYLEAARRTRPEASAEPLRQPLYVIGLPRTGTTLLYNLLCQDPNGRPLMGWETFSPVLPPPRGQRAVKDKRRAQGRRRVALINRMAPRLKSVHDLVSDGPEECTWLLHNTLLSGSFLLQAQVPSYAQYLRERPPETWRHVYAEYAQYLQHLQYNEPERHWVLKSPAHQLGLSGLMDVIPNACVVQTHRDPKKVIGSCCSLFSVVRGIYSDDVRDESLGAEVMDYLDLVVNRAMTARDDHADRVFDVRFEHLVSDPVGTVQRIYQRFGYPFDPRMEQGMRRWLAENPQGKYGSHKYDLAQFGLTEDRVTDVFGDYQRRYEAVTERQ